MAASRVNNSNIFSEAWNNLYSLINDRSNVADPISASGEIRKFVYSDDPDVKASDFKGYPYIVVYDTNANIPQEGSSSNGKRKFVYWDCEIEVVTSDRAYGNMEGMGKTHMNSIMDDIFSTLIDATNRQTLRGNGLYKFEPNASDRSTDAEAQTKVFRKSVLLQFMTRMRMSS